MTVHAFNIHLLSSTIAINQESSVKHSHRGRFICVYILSIIYRLSPGLGNKISMVVKHDFLASFQDI